MYDIETIILSVAYYYYNVHLSRMLVMYFNLNFKPQVEDK